LLQRTPDGQTRTRRNCDAMLRKWVLVFPVAFQLSLVLGEMRGQSTGVRKPLQVRQSRDMNSRPTPLHLAYTWCLSTLAYPKILRSRPIERYVLHQLRLRHLERASASTCRVRVPAFPVHMPGSAIRRAQEQFNDSYCAILRLLDQAFNGGPQTLEPRSARCTALRPRPRR